MRHLALALFASWLTAQTPTPPPLPPYTPTDLEGLARRVTTAHHPKGPVPPVMALRCNLELHVIDAKAEQGGQADLGVQFLEWTPEGSKKPRSLIRYEVQTAGPPIVRGRDQNGPWHLFQGEPQTLRDANFTQDLAALERDTNLAKQLIRFLDPGQVLRLLQNPTSVRDTVLPLDRATKVPCEMVAGDLVAFPLLQQGGEDAPARVEIYVTKADGRLLAIDACPLVQGKPDHTRGERVVLKDLHDRDGMLVPRELIHSFREPDGQLRPKTRAVLTTLSLRPELRAEDFNRKR